MSFIETLDALRGSASSLKLFAKTSRFTPAARLHTEDHSTRLATISASIKDDIKQIHAVKEDLDHILSDLHLQYTQILDLLTPVHALPNEILSHIFELVTQSSSDRNGFALAVSSVCSTWREIAIHCPGLWTELHFEWPRTQLETWKSRCGYRVPEIHARLDGPTRVRTQKALRNFMNGAPNPRPFEIVSIACATIDEIIEDVLEHLNDPGAEWLSLRRLELLVSQPSPISGEHLIESYMIPTPRLEHLQIKGAPFVVEDFAPTLLYLQLFDVALPAERWYQTFASCNRLEQLDLKLAWIDENPPESESDEDSLTQPPPDFNDLYIQFSVLATLDIRLTHTRLLNRVACFQVPALECLTIQLEESAIGGLDVMDFGDWLADECSSLTELRYSGPASHFESHVLSNLSEYNEYLPRLSKLSFLPCPWDGVEALRRAIGFRFRSTDVPTIQVLSLGGSDMPPQEAFANLRNFVGELKFILDLPDQGRV